MNSKAETTEIIIPLIDPVKTYSAAELRDMPLSKMTTAIKAQEDYFFIEKLTRMGGVAIEVRRLMQNGFKLIKRVEGKRTKYEINGEAVKPVIIRQLENVDL